jgi:cytidylate kinase
MIRILTIEREYGSGAADIARKLADRLGWKLWDQLMTNQIARLLECESKTVEEREERNDPLHHRLFKAFMRGSFEGTLNAPRLKLVDAECIREAGERVVREAAEQGNSILVGRGSAYYLRDRPDAFHVFIYAPFEEKVLRLQRAGKTEKEAVELVETVDLDRSAYIKNYFKLDWPARHFFHLMVNSTMGEEPAVQIILDGMAEIEKQKK